MRLRSLKQILLLIVLLYTKLSRFKIGPHPELRENKTFD